MVSERRLELERREQEKARAEQEKRDAEAARAREREYQRAITAGGAVAANARWERLYDEMYDKYGGRYELCQWEDEDDDGNYEGRRCTRRTTGHVYCAKHNRQLERESAKRRREQAGLG